MAQKKLSSGVYADIIVSVTDLPPGAWSYSADPGGILNSVVAVTIAAAVAGARNSVMGVQINSEALGAATEVAIRDGAGGAVLWRLKIGTGGFPNGLSVPFHSPVTGSTGNLLEFVTLTASVTGAVYFNAQGLRVI